jgi:hypothetical protein
MDEEYRDDSEVKKEEEEKKENVRVEKKNWLSSVSDKNNSLEKVRGNPWIISTIVLGAIVLVMLIANLGGITGNAISSGSAGDKLVDYLNTVADSEVTLVGVDDFQGLYEVTVEYQGSNIPVYMTHDGKYYTTMLSPLEVEEQTPVEIPKSEKPEVDLYVMSFCPFGNRAEDTMLPVYELLKDKVNWNVRYIVSVSGETVNSLHGQPEVDQNIREACVLKNYGMDALWSFMTDVNANCGGDGSCWESVASASGVDTSVIESCVSEEGLDLMKAEADASSEAGASGSPTLIINGVESTIVYQYENSEAYKQEICSAFENAPEECSTQLSASTSASAGGSC